MHINIGQEHLKERNHSEEAEVDGKLILSRIQCLSLRYLRHYSKCIDIVAILMFFKPQNYIIKTRNYWAFGFCPLSGILRSRNLQYRTMDKVQKPQ
jgi:hypothetical protein